MQPQPLSRRTRRNRKRNRLRPSWWHWLLAGLVFSVLAIGVYVRYGIARVVSQVYQPVPTSLAGGGTAVPIAFPVTGRAGERVNVLVMGTDKDGYRTDTMLLVSFDPEQRKAAVISIPRDTRARLAGRGTVEKINGAYAYGVGDKQFPAPYRAMKTVEELLHVPVHYYITINLDAFKKMVDAAGGVWMDLPIAMNYDDPYQNLHIHLQKGRQKLDGEHAMEFVRFRHNNDGTGYPTGDLGRIAAQQRFLKSVLAQLFSPSGLLHLPTLVNRVAKDVQMNIDPDRLGSLVGDAVKMHQEDIQFFTLPGSTATLLDQPSGAMLSFFIPDPSATQVLMDQQVLAIDRSRNARIRVRFICAEAKAESVQRLAEELHWYGYDVLPLQVAADVPDGMQVVQTGMEPEAELVVRSLQLLGENVDHYVTRAVTDPALNADADVTIFMGKSVSVAGNG